MENCTCGCGHPDALRHAALREASVEPDILRNNRTQQVIRQVRLRHEHGDIVRNTLTTLPPGFSLPSVTPTTPGSPPPLPSNSSKTSAPLEPDSSIGLESPRVGMEIKRPEINGKPARKRSRRKTHQVHGMQLRSCKRCILYELNSNGRNKTARRAQNTLKGRRRQQF